MYVAGKGSLYPGWVLLCFFFLLVLISPPNPLSNTLIFSVYAKAKLTSPRPRAVSLWPSYLLAHS